MSRFLILICFCFLPFLLLGNIDRGQRYLFKIQDRHPLLERACTAFFEEDMEVAEAQFLMTIDHFSDEDEKDLLAIANLAYGICLFEKKQKHESIPYFQTAYELAKNLEEPFTYLNSIDALFNLYQGEGQYQKAIELKRERLELTPIRNNTRRYERDLRAMATLFIQVSAFDSARVYLDAALELAAESENNNRIAQTHATYSIYYQALNDYEHALYYRMEQLKHLQSRVQISRALALCKLKIANIYQMVENWEKAKKYASESLELCDSLGLPVIKVDAMTTLGNIALAEGNEGNSLAYYQNILNLLRPLHRTPRIIKTLHEMGQLLQQEARFKEAEACFVEAVDLAKNNQDKNYLYAKSLSKLGLLKIEQEQFKLAIPVLEEAAREAFSFGALHIYQEVNKGLAEAYQREGESSIAFQHLQIAYSVKDSLFTKEKEEMMLEMDAKYQVAQKEKALIALNLDNEYSANELLQSQKKQQVFGLGLLALLATVLFIFQLYRLKQRTNQQLEKVNFSLSQSLSEKEFLLKEIHHRVKNNLQIISSMLSLQADKIEDDKTLAVIQEGQNRVESMVLIHEYLYKSENLAMIDCKEYIERLTTHLVNSYQVNLSKIEVLKQIDPIPMKPDRLISLGLIINELISNVFKYAFKDKQEGTVNISLKNKHEKIQLIVEDNGIGLPKTFNLKKQTTLGFQLVHAFAKKLKATLKIQNNGGTLVTIDIPKTLDK